MDSSGNFNWVKQITNASAIALALDKDGEVYTTGRFKQIANFDPGGSNFSDSTNFNENIYVNKYSNNGNFIWAKTFKGPPAPDVLGVSIQIDNQKNVYTGGRAEGNFDFDPNLGVYNPSSTIIYNNYLSVLDSLGNFVSAKFFPSVAGFRGLELDSNHNIFLVGYCRPGLADYDPDSSVYMVNAINLPNDGGDFHIIKMNGCNAEFDTITINTCISINFNNQILTSSGIYHGMFKNVDGCDSIVTLILNFNPPPYNQSVGVNVCSGNNFTFPDGLTFTNILSDTSHVSHLVTALGCDSLITTLLHINSVYNQSDSINLCRGNDYTFYDGLTFTNILSDTSHESHLVTALGCDSLITTLLHVNSVYNQSDSINLCRGNNHTFYDGVTFTNILTDTSHVSHFVTVLGCDSNIVTSLLVQTIDTTVTQSGAQLTSNAVNSFYQWYDCTNQTILPGETNSFFVATQNGIYAVIVSVNGCSDTTNCYVVNEVNVLNVDKEKRILIYPNPSSSILYVEYLGMYDDPTNTEVVLSNSLGEVVSRNKLDLKGKANLQIANLQTGLYYLCIGPYCKKVIKE